MNNTAHSPEPWHISGYDSETGVPATIGGNAGPICDLYRRNPNVVGNAAAIINAPAMLNLLREVHKHFVFVGEEDLGIAHDVRKLLVRVGICAECKGTGVETDANGVQRDDVCPKCGGNGCHQCEGD